MTREIPLYTLEGVPDADVSTHYVSTEDGLGLSLLRFQKNGSPADGDAVLIVHGLTTSSDMFIMPEHYNLVRYLHDHGYEDVWTMDTRMSNRHPYNLWRHRFSMDDLALFDFPPAIETIREQIGTRGLHVIAHCLGSTSFTMSLFGRQVDGINSVIANSVALTPHIRPWSRLKLAVTPFFIEYVLGFTYLNPLWIEEPGMSRGKLFAKVVSFFHRECDVPACHMLSTMWGTGWPALWEHENLAEVTHRRAGDLFGGTNVNYYRHVNKMISEDGAVKYQPGNPKYDPLPDDYFAHAEDMKTPVLFVTGEENHIFTDSNIRCYERLKTRYGADHHELEVFSGYGHQDVFMGKNCDEDVFPTLVDFLDRHRSNPQVSRKVS